MEKTYEALIERIKEQHFQICYNIGYLKAYNLNATDEYKHDRLTYAQGELYSCESLLEAEGIFISKEESDSYIEEGRQGYLEDNNNRENLITFTS